MEDDQKSTKDTNLPAPKDFSQDKGGKNLVDGWRIEDWGSFGEYIREGLKQETLTCSSFKSAQEGFKFMKGIGKYRDNNSFFYSNQDHSEFEQEGFSQSIQCPNCLEDLKKQLEEDSIPEEEVINPVIHIDETEYQTKSFKPDEEKYVRKFWYQCGEHPDVSMMMTETYYE